MNNKKRKIKVTSVVIATGALIVASVLVSLSSLTARAATDATELLKKSLALGISKCVNKTYMQAGPIKESDFRNTGVSLIMTSKGRQDKVVYVPTQFGNTLTTAKVTCQELFQGANRGSKKGRADGLMQLYNKSNPGLTDLSYEVGESGSGGDKKGCIAIRYFTSDKSKKTTNKICFKLDSDNRVVFKSNSDFEVNKITTPIGLSFYLSTQEIGVENAENTRVSFSALTQVKDGDNWDTVVQNMDKGLKSKDNPVYNAYNNDGQRLGLSYDSTDSSTTNNSSTFSDYVFTNNPAVVLKAFTGKGLFSDVKFTAQEKYDLLEAYYNRYASGSEKVLSTGDCFSTKEQAKQKSNSGYAHYENGKWCAVLNSEQVPSDLKFNVVNGSNNGLTPKDFNGILKELTDWNFNALDGSTGDNAGVNGSTDNGEDGDEDIQSPCTLAGGPLSWILCPAMSVMGAAVEGLYSWIENQFLSIDANLYSNSSETYNAWKNFQSYANIFFIILLVFVIISQVTGFGISNYGIKKTLPKLVIAIILINISFFVCQMAVDLSNILGSSIKELFDGMAGDISTANLGTSIGAVVSYVVGAGELTGLAIGAFSIAHLIPSTFETWMIPFILTLIACVLGVIFFFIILCVRQAAVIVLIVLAPLAIAAYALPNTKKIFERWFKLFTALLLVYPICGLLMGGGNFVSRLLMEGAADGEGGFGMILIALLANVIPFFLIPGILRSSMAGLGNLGAKIAGFNDRLNRRIGRAVTTSEAVKEAQRQAVKNRNLARYERLNSGKGVRQRVARGLRRMGRTDAADSLERRSKRDMARSWSAYSRVQNDDNDIEEMAENINPDSIEARRMTRRREFADQQINDLANLMALGDVRYTDSTGASIKINADDVGSLENAHMHYMRQAELATDEATRKANTQRAQAVQQLLFAKGDTGRSKAMRNLYDHVFGDGTSTNPGYQKSETARDMFSRISADGKAMAALKNEDPGSFNLTNDMMGDGNLLSRQTYELPKAEKITAGNVAQLSDNYYDNLERNDNYKSLSDDEIKSLDNIFTRAFTDERLSANLKNKDNATRVMNKIREEAHERRVADWIGKNPGKTRADYEAQSGTFQKLAAGDTMKVPHERTRKAAMPGDWRRDPLNGNRWTEYKSGVPHRVLNVQETRRANAIEAQNIQADIDNEVNR